MDEWRVCLGDRRKKNGREDFRVGVGTIRRKSVAAEVFPKIAYHVQRLQQQQQRRQRQTLSSPWQLCKEVLEKKFVDGWPRYKWQGRGAGHTHGLYWIDVAPNSEFDLVTWEERQLFCRQHGGLTSRRSIRNLIPIPTDSFEGCSLMSLPQSEQTNTVGYMSSIVNRVWRHTCGAAYCQV